MAAASIQVYGIPNAAPSSVVWPIRWMVFTRSRPALTSAFTMRVSFRMVARCPPVQAFRDALAFPSGVRGPLACSHGFQVRISCACRALRSGVQPFSMVFLQ
jgi:hypothetical protein